jgi:hypothetical protein
MTDLRIRQEPAVDRHVAAPRRRTLSAAQVLLVGLVTYSLAILLNASWLQRWANNLPIGTERTVMVNGANTARRISHALWLDRPGNAIDRLRHQPVPPLRVPVVPTVQRRDPAPPAPVTSPPTTTPVSTSSSPSTTVPRAVVRPADRTDSSEPAIAVSTPTTTNKPQTVAGLSLWYGGDSLAQGIGEAMQRVATETDGTKVTGKGIVSSGLSRPDVLDWAVEAGTVQRSGGTDVIVLMLGANDTADIATPTGVAAFGDPDWLQEYRLRIAAVMAQVDGTSTKLVWLGLPPVRSASLEEKLQRIDALVRAEAVLHRNVTYVDLHKLFGNADGSYRGYCDGFDGGQVLCRSNDGVHFNDAGYEMVARVVMQAAAR